MTYEATRERLETYFDRTAAEAWARLTSDAPVSRIRATVRAGRDEMRALLLSRLPDDLRGARVLDAGCGTGATAVALAERGAPVVAADVSPTLVRLGAERTPVHLAPRIDWRTGDMLSDALGRFDHVIAMDSLIHYAAADVASALDRLAARTDGRIVFTLAPKTPLLTAMWWAGQAFPRADRSPAIRPHRPAAIRRALRRLGRDAPLTTVGRVSTGFYISEAHEIG